MTHHSSLITHHARLFIASGIFHPESGGPATYLYDVLPELQKLGWDVRALAYGSGDTAGYPYPLMRIPRRALPLRVAQYARAARPLMRWAEVVYVHTLGLPLIGNKPRVIKIVGDQAWERAVRRGWIPPTEDVDRFQHKRYGALVTLQKAVRSREVRGMDAVIVPSEYLKRVVLGWGVDEARVRVIYNALPPHPSPDVGARGRAPLQTQSDTPAPQSITQSDARTELHLDDTPLILTSARLLPWKGIDHLMAALRRVPDLRLLVAGDGPMAGPWQQQAADMGLTARVTFLGRVPRERLALYMKAADYLALYSGYEGMSHTLLEALHAGTPVIASDKGGNPEVVQHGVNGLLVPYVDVEALAAALVEAFQPGKRAVLAANTHTGLERFDFARMVAKTDAVLREVLERSMLVSG
jgi:glycosyltransferase involved in cell wall biosynthesis